MQNEFSWHRWLFSKIFIECKTQLIVFEKPTDQLSLFIKLYLYNKYNTRLKAEGLRLVAYQSRLFSGKYARFVMYKNITVCIEANKYLLLLLLD